MKTSSLSIKRTSLAPLAALVTAALVGVALLPQANAADAFWVGGTTPRINSASNYSTTLDGTGAAPGTITGADLFFNSTGTITNAGTTQVASFAANSMTFNSSVTSALVWTEGTSILTIAGGGITVNSGAAAITLNRAITLSAAQTWTNNSLNLLTIGTGNKVIGGNTLTVSGSGNTTFSGGGISGLGGLTKSGAGTVTLSVANTYDGGTTISSGTLAVNSNASLGATAGALTFTGDGTLRTDASFTTTRSHGINPGVVGTINTNGNTLTQNGVISGLGALTKSGTGTLILGGANTYTGNTTISTGGITLADTGEFRFKLADAGVNNSIQGLGTLAANGLFRLDISSVTDTVGTWTLVNQTLTDTYGGTFNLAFVGGPTFTNSGPGTYTSGNWTFTESTGVLSVVPEPGTFAMLLAGFGMLLGFQRTRRHAIKK